MKFLKTIFLVIGIVIVLVVLGAVIFIKTVDINKFRNQITSVVSTHINKKVHLENISFRFSFNEGALLLLEGVKVGDIKGNDDYAIEASVVALDVDLWALVTVQKLNIRSIKFKKPIIKIIQSDGNEEIIVKPKSIVKKKSLSANIPKIIDVVDDEVLGRVRDIKIQKIDIYDGKLILITKSGHEEKTLTFNHMNVHLKNVMFSEPIDFSIKGALFSNERNIDINGKIEVNEESYHISNLKFRTDLRYLNLKDLNLWVSIDNYLDLSQKILGLLDFKVNNIKVSNKNFDFNGRLLLSDGQVKLKSIDQVVDNIDLDVEFTDKEILIRELYFYIFQGRSTTKGSIIEYFSNPHWSVQTSFEELSIKEILKGQKLPLKFDGKIFGKITSKGSGFSGEEIISSALGQIDVWVENGKILDINILRVVLQKLAFIPGLTQILEGKMSRYNKERLALKDTEFEQLNLFLNVNSKDIQIEELVAQSKEFAFDMTGTFDKTLNGEIQSKFTIAQRLSIDMLASVPELKYLKNNNNEIFIKMNDFRGNILDYRPNPVNVDIPIKVIRGKVEEEAKKAIRKYLKIPQNNDPNQNQSGLPSQNTPSDTQQKTPDNKSSQSIEDVLINSALDMIFGK